VTEALLQQREVKPERVCLIKSSREVKPQQHELRTDTQYLLITLCVVYRLDPYPFITAVPCAYPNQWQIQKKVGRTRKRKKRKSTTQ
jgi:hypothetical protein